MTLPPIRKSPVKPLAPTFGWNYVRRSNLLPVCQPLEPRREARSLRFLGLGLVRLPLGWCHTDVYTHAGGVFHGGSTPGTLGLFHADILDSQIMLDKPSPT